ncbi:hypothetical protein E3J79_03145 [Candidatus Dependentiae bacterium]|nr:MAG: hypothetical protein E3J79_03145 [Candidatus Dependentiae bacterium]
MKRCFLVLFPFFSLILLSGCMGDLAAYVQSNHYYKSVWASSCYALLVMAKAASYIKPYYRSR